MAGTIKKIGTEILYALSAILIVGGLYLSVENKEQVTEGAILMNKKALGEIMVLAGIASIALVLAKKD